MTNGLLLALLAYAMFSWSDAAVKALGGQLTIFEIGFFLTLVSGIVILVFKPEHERWRDFWRMRRPWAVQMRALVGVVASVLSVVAFTTIPLAEVYALIFLAPLFVTILSMIFLKEEVGPWRWFAIVAGFAGVMLVVRPGFREVAWGHLAALAIALLAAIAIVLMRSMMDEKRTTVLGYLMLYTLALNVTGMAVTSFSLPTLVQGGLLILAGVFAAGGNICLLQATRFAQANLVAPAQYTQMVWAVVLGAIFFSEIPDLLALAGLAVIAGSGLITVVRERIRLGTVRWNPFARTRL